MGKRVGQRNVERRNTGSQGTSFWKTRTRGKPARERKHMGMPRLISMRSNCEMNEVAGRRPDLV